MTTGINNAPFTTVVPTRRSLLQRCRLALQGAWADWHAAIRLHALQRALAQLPPAVLRDLGLPPRGSAPDWWRP